MVAMATAPKSVEIRMYQVGFGDCFLVSFMYSGMDRRHVLIDFGTAELPKRGKPLKPARSAEYMPTIAKDIKAACGDRLTAVIATHRHADHISGFATDESTGRSGEIIRSLKPRIIIQPWTEDPAAAKNARSAVSGSRRSPKSFTSGLAAMHDIARAIHHLAMQRPVWMGASLQRELAFIGLDNIANESAVRNLIAMGAAKGSKAIWAHHGSATGLEQLLPGVKVRVLGPPDLTQTEAIRKMRKTDPDQFWHLLAGSRNSEPLARGMAPAKAARSPSRVPAEARWFRDRLDRLRGDQLLQIVRTLDDQMNNTSLILLFEVFGKKLLFPGDAQIENWSWALQDAPNANETRRMLAGVDVYKVGHHGSLNATPKKLLWENFQKRNGSENDGLRTLLSTLPGKHGKVQNRTEVPRRPLLAALKEQTIFQSTDDLKFGKAPDLCQVVVIHK
jgi:hypothetical protein